MNGSSNPPNAAPAPSSTDPQIAVPDKIVLWMFLLCFIGIAIILIGDMIAGMIGRH